jgi:hypothetical protein
MIRKIIYSLLLLLYVTTLEAQKKPPKPRFVEDKPSGGHWICPKGWMVSGGGDKPIVCVPYKPPDPSAVVTGSLI